MEPPTSLADYTSEPLIVPHLLQRAAAGVIQELSQALGREGRVPDPVAFCQATLKREVLASTAVDHDMAFPHARLGGLKQLSFALGRSIESFLWGESGARPVRLVFLLAVPADDTANYLPLISGLARLGKETQFLEKLYAARGAGEVLAILKQVKLHSSRLPSL